MKAKISIYCIVIFFVIFIQTTFLEYLRVFNTKPNLLIVFVIAVALLRGNVEGAIIGLFVGFCQDAISGKVIGFYSLIGMYLGLVIGSVNKRLYRENFFVIIFFTFISSLLYELVVFFLTSFMNVSMNMVFAIQNIIIPEAIYNSMISIFVYIFVLKLHRRFENKFKVTRRY